MYVFLLIYFLILCIYKQFYIWRKCEINASFGIRGNRKWSLVSILLCIIFIAHDIVLNYLLQPNSKAAVISKIYWFARLDKPMNFINNEHFFICDWRRQLDWLLKRLLRCSSIFHLIQMVAILCKPYIKKLFLIIFSIFYHKICVIFTCNVLRKMVCAV